MNTSLNQRGAMLQELSRRGTVILLGLAVASTGLILFLGAMTTVLREQVSLTYLVQSAQASQLAHSGIEYALWEMNYSGPPYYTEADWDNSALPNHTYTNPAIPGMSVTVIDDGAQDPIVIRSQGTASNLTLTIQVDVSRGGAAPPAGDKLFDNMLYTRDANLFLYGTAGGAITIDGYDSNDREYDPGATLPAEQVLIMSDYWPFRSTTWTTQQGNDSVAATILAGNVTAKAKVVVRSPSSGELDFQSLAEEIPGYAVYDSTVEGSVVLQGGAWRDFDRTTAYYDPTTEYVAKDPLNDGFASTLSIDTIDLIDGDLAVVCPGEQLALQQILINGGTLLLGCSPNQFLADGVTPNPHYCGNTFQDPLFPLDPTKSCPAANPNAMIKIVTGDGATSGYALSITSATNPGQLIVYSPSRLYYGQFGVMSGGFYISSGGIQNNVTKASGAIEPSALAFYGGWSGGEWSGASQNNVFATTTAFHGTVFDPLGDVYFHDPNNSSVKANMDFYGGLNVNQIRATNGASVRFHWDRPLGATGSPPPPPPGGPFRPSPGSWQICKEPTCS